MVEMRPAQWDGVIPVMVLVALLILAKGHRQRECGTVTKCLATRFTAAGWCTPTTHPNTRSHGLLFFRYQRYKVELEILVTVCNEFQNPLYS